MLIRTDYLDKSISRDVMNPNVLIPVLLNQLDVMRTEALSPLDNLHHRLIANVLYVKRLHNYVINDCLRPTNDQWTHKNEFMEQLIEDLDKFAPDTHYFGFKRIDETNLGYWPKWEKNQPVKQWS